MSRGSPHFWVKYMIPEDAKLHSTTFASNDTVPLDMTEFDQLMMEARAVLSRYFLFVLDALANYNYLETR
jgi:peroxin-3